MSKCIAKLIARVRGVGVRPYVSSISSSLSQKKTTKEVTPVAQPVAGTRIPSPRSSQISSQSRNKKEIAEARLQYYLDALPDEFSMVEAQASLSLAKGTTEVIVRELKEVGAVKKKGVKRYAVCNRRPFDMDEVRV